MGGIIAYEVAQQLWARGERVELLTMVNTKCPSPVSSLRSTVFGLRGGAFPLTDRLLYHWHNLALLPMTKRCSYLSNMVSLALTRIAHRFCPKIPLSHGEEAFELNLCAFTSYIPQP